MDISKDNRHYSIGAAIEETLFIGLFKRLHLAFSGKESIARPYFSPFDNQSFLKSTVYTWGINPFPVSSVQVTCIEPKERVRDATKLSDSYIINEINECFKKQSAAGSQEKIDRAFFIECQYNDSVVLYSTVNDFFHNDTFNGFQMLREDKETLDQRFSKHQISICESNDLSYLVSYKGSRFRFNLDNLPQSLPDFYRRFPLSIEHDNLTEIVLLYPGRNRGIVTYFTSRK